MNRPILFIACLLFSFGARSQVVIPKFEADTTGITTNIFPEIKNYDLLIVYASYSNWSFDKDYHILFLKDNHWRKLQYKKSSIQASDALKPSPIKETPTNDAECEALYKKLVANNLFKIEDDSKIPPCENYFTYDNVEYTIWVITPAKSRHLYYYAPEYFEKHCPSAIRKQALKVIDLFKYW